MPKLSQGLKQNDSEGDREVQTADPAFRPIAGAPHGNREPLVALRQHVGGKAIGLSAKDKPVVLAEPVVQVAAVGMAAQGQESSTGGLLLLRNFVNSDSTNRSNI